jgi:D-alanyl-D-alanine carboxypeptidase
VLPAPPLLSASHQSLAADLESLVERTHRKHKQVHSIALGVESGSGFRWTGAAGIADPRTGSRIGPATPFLIASITKMFTASATMIFEEREQLSLSDSISRFLPAQLISGLHRHGGVEYSASLTVRDLLAQTSGLPDYFLEKPRGGRSVYQALLDDGDREWNLDDVIELTRRQFPAKFVPGSVAAARGSRGRAHYSDTNYKLLGAILERLAGASLPAIFEELFFDPLALRETYLYGTPRAGGSGTQRAAVFHRGRPLHLDRLLSTHGPEGGIVSTLDDLLRFGRAFFHGTLFKRPDTVGRMTRDWNGIFYPLQYGYGVMRFKLPRFLAPFGYSPELIGHSGSSGSFLYRVPELDLCITGTINQMAAPRIPFPLMIKVAQLYRRAVTAG